MEKETVFPKGVFVEYPNEKAPDFVKARVSVKCDEFVIFMREHQNKAGYINLDLLKSKKGTLYFTLNQFEPKEKTEEKTELEAKEIPF